MSGAGQRITTALLERFSENNAAQNYFGELLNNYLESGFSPPHLASEIETQDDGKFWSNVWEATLYRHFNSLGLKLKSLITKRGQEGPDFCANHDGRTIWIEAIVPAPDGISTEWLAPPREGEFRVKTKPDAPRVLRCTSAIHDKQKKFEEYRTKGIVGAQDCTVIAVNICRLSDWDLDGNGISQLPLAVEAVFPVGHLGIPLTREGKIDGPAQHVGRYTLTKVNGQKIQTANFFDQKYANVSGLIQGHQKDFARNDLNLSVVHNPHASNPLPIKLFGAYKEFVIDIEGEDFKIRNIVE